MRSANLEAIAHSQRGNEATSLLPESARKDRMELDFHLVLGPCLIATQGPASNKAMATFARARELCERLGDPPEQLQVMFWLTTASVMRGELPVAEETIAALLQLAEVRDDRPALLNAMRGQAMIRLFMGHLTGAREAIERAYEAFEASSEEDRLAARVAGQDAGVADLALMSWALWLLGHADTAIMRMDAAIQRADAISHPHSQAYACYYACPSSRPSRRVPDCARSCRTLYRPVGGAWIPAMALGARHSGHMRGVARSFTQRTRGDPCRVGRISQRGLSVGHHRSLRALMSALLIGHDYEAALELIEHGLATTTRNSERILEAELYRLKARVLVVRGGPDAGPKRRHCSTRH